MKQISAGEHTLHHVMHVNPEIKNYSNEQFPGAYELIVNFTFEEKI